MKKLFFVLCVAFCVSCRGNSGSAVLESSEAPVDTPAVAEESVEEVAPDRSSDMCVWQVSGPVKRVAYDNGSAVAFNEEGVVFSMKMAKVHYADPIEHNAKGQIVSAQFHNADFEGMTSSRYTWTYNTDGTLAQWRDEGHEYAAETNYKNYDKRGLPAVEVVSSGAESTDVEITYQLTYSDFDEHGNWRKCVKEGKGRISEDDGETYAPYTDTKTVTRTIEYRQ